MLSATERLRRRLRPSELDLFEPAGQDGRTCQYLAVIHQLELHGVITSFDARELEEAMISWLLDQHHDDVVGEPGFHTVEPWLSGLSGLSGTVRAVSGHCQATVKLDT